MNNSRVEGFEGGRTDGQTDGWLDKRTEGEDGRMGGASGFRQVVKNVTSSEIYCLSVKLLGDQHGCLHAYFPHVIAALAVQTIMQALMSREAITAVARKCVRVYVGMCVCVNVCMCADVTGVDMCILVN